MLQTVRRQGGVGRKLLATEADHLEALRRADLRPRRGALGMSHRMRDRRRHAQTEDRQQGDPRIAVEVVTDELKHAVILGPWLTSLSQ